MAGPTAVIDPDLAWQLPSLGTDPDELIEVFQDWKTNWPAFEYLSQHFGKDSAFRSPKVNNAYRLMHVHIAPQVASDLRRWDGLLLQKRKKTSDRWLIYVEGRSGLYLLIGVLENAHAASLSQSGRALLNIFAGIAEDFINSGQFDLGRYYQYGDNDASDEVEEGSIPVLLL